MLAQVVCDEASAAMQEHIFALRLLPFFHLKLFNLDMEQNSEDSQGIRKGVGLTTHFRAKC
ncbi:hypothetical protein D9754_04035 [Planomicrobium sp. Y74]|nr:hypothetical protein D9754_04035 [Planomicrobium sp. Y74]